MKRRAEVFKAARLAIAGPGQNPASAQPTPKVVAPKMRRLLMGADSDFGIWVPKRPLFFLSFLKRRIPMA